MDQPAQHPEPMFPGIDYKHVLRELSVNRAEPCEVIRELISNSYDAKAENIWIFPLLQYKGFIFIDNGDGLSQTKSIRDTTPYLAFFSIGKSTKQLGEAIGYKCQGSKLCFASNRVTVITRCTDEETWRIKTVDNPTVNLDERYDITPTAHSAPWVYIQEIFSGADERTKAIVDVLNQQWFETNLVRGTCIIVQGYRAESFDTYFNPTEKGACEAGYLYNYIRHSTKHADTCQLRTEQGFPAAPAQAILGRAAAAVQLGIWTGEAIDIIPHGYPYLGYNPNAKPASPNDFNSLGQGTFQDRFAKQFTFSNQKYAFIFAIDGNRRRLTEYKHLGRSRNAASGVRLTDQCGVYISAHGVKCATYPDILKNSALEHFRCLADGDGQRHYTLVIDGPFPLVTNRNALTEEAIATLSDDGFIGKLKDFLVDAETKSKVFRELVARLNKDRNSWRRNDQVDKANRSKEYISRRSRFTIELSDGKKVTFVCPEDGEEHGVGSLYAMLATFVEMEPSRVDENLAPFWLRPLTFSGVGIDAVAVPIGTQALIPGVRKMLEYKYRFSVAEEYNHPLCVTDHIVAWELSEVDEGAQVRDASQTSGNVRFIDGIPSTLAYRVADIESDDGDSFNNVVTVIGLRELLLKSFSIRIRPSTQR